MKTILSLQKLGYDRFYENARLELGAEFEQVARVTAEHKGIYEIMNDVGTYQASVTGKRMLTALSRDDYPAVGDWVIIKNYPDDTNVIVDILPRKTTLHKKYGGKDESQLILANVDIAFIVESADRDYNLNRFERYLVLAKEGGVKPVIIINKSDLIKTEDLQAITAEINERFGDIDILCTSAVNDADLSILSKFINKGTTCCFLGSSGVGKSSLISKLVNEDNIMTTEISEKTGRGKHTTTSRQMYFTKNGGIIIDNPGSREVGVVNSERGISEVFVDIESIASGCKYNNCSHIKEPECAIIRALESGAIRADQYDNYLKLKKETEHFNLNAYGKRQKDKKFGKFINNAKKDIKKYKPR
jgi:ribosome biogenesis GTPase / thiamine phosphate phosphatase